MSRKGNRHALLEINAKIAEWMRANITHFMRTNGTVIWAEVLEALESRFGAENITIGRARHVYKTHVQKKPKKQEKKVNVNSPITFERKGDTGKGTVIIPAEVRPMNLKLDKIVELFELDLEMWECTGYNIKAWEVGMKNPLAGKENTPEGTNPAVQVTNWSISAKFALRIKPLITAELFKDVFENAKAEGKAIRGRVKKRKGFAPHSGNLFVPLMYDVHLGKLAWAGETGENYDLGIAERRFKIIFADLLERAVLEGFEKSIVVVGQDFFQYDNDNNTTNKGTPMPTESRYQKLLRRGIDLYRWMIHQLAAYAPVDVMYVPGNHDKTISYSAFEALRGYFWYDENVKVPDYIKNVTVDEDVKRRHYREWGKTGLGFSHGDEEKGNLTKIVPYEAREIWGRVKYFEILTGHLHREIVKEDNGIIVRVGNSLSGTDDWHYKKGFVGSRIGAYALMYNKKHIGPRTTLYSMVDLDEEEDQDITPN